MITCPIQNNKEITDEHCGQQREYGLCYHDECRNQVENDETFDAVLALFEPMNEEDC